MVHYLSARKLVFLSPNIILDKSEMIFFLMLLLRAQTDASEIPSISFMVAHKYLTPLFHAAKLVCSHKCTINFAVTVFVASVTNSRVFMDYYQQKKPFSSKETANFSVTGQLRRTEDDSTRGRFFSLSGIS